MKERDDLWTRYKKERAIEERQNQKSRWIQIAVTIGFVLLCLLIVRGI